MFNIISIFYNFVIFLCTEENSDLESKSLRIYHYANISWFS